MHIQQLHQQQSIPFLIYLMMISSFQTLLRRSTVGYRSNSYLGFHSLTQKSSISHPNRIPLTKIVATIGPASEQLQPMEQVVAAGMRIMRINFSHATYEEADLRVRNLKQCKGLSALHSTNQDHVQNIRGVMLDTQGPEIRTGSWSGKGEEEFAIGQKVTLTTEKEYSSKQERFSERPKGALVWISYEKLLVTVHPGSCILLDDGAIELRVDSLDVAGKSIECTVLNTGALGNKKGVNMPGLAVDLPAMSAKDKLDIKWGVENDIDYIAASFTRKAADVREIREYAAALLKEKHPDGDFHVPLIISKIESTEALANFDSILEESDAIMVARGDLAVEIPMETLTNVQKDIVHKCNQAGKPVIVATQMLESMQKNPRPTRAECTDVANAVFDGADCVMLSGESAKGRYPIAAVSMMKKIIDQSELEQWRKDQVLLTYLQTSPHRSGKPAVRSPHIIVDGIAQAAVLASKLMSLQGPVDGAVSCIVVLAKSSAPADVNAVSEVSKYICQHRPHVPVVCAVPNRKSGRLLQLYKGLHPVVLPSGNCEKSLTEYLRALGFLQPSGLEEKYLLLEAGASDDFVLKVKSAT